MTRIYSKLAVALVAASMDASAFTPSRPAHLQSSNLFFADRIVASKNIETENETADKVEMTSTSAEPSQATTALPDNTLEKDAATATAKSPAARKPPTKKKAGGGPKHKQGVLSPFVVLGKRVLGDDELNKLRGKIISEHSKVIGKFVETSESPFGQRALRALFALADADKNGTIEEEELAKALRSLGFELNEKQTKGIFDRADADKNGAIDFDEFKSSAPSTLRTNLTKLAKKNGGDMGLLV